MIRQAVEKRLWSGSCFADTKTRELTEQLIDIHYQDQLLTDGKTVKPGTETYRSFPFELKLQALFNHIVADLTEEELCSLLKRSRAFTAGCMWKCSKLYSKNLPRLGMEALKQGVPLEQMVESFSGWP